MKVTLYNAITADGFIATVKGDSEWVTDVDVKIFDAKIKSFGCIVMGGKTYRQFKGEYFPKKDAINIVVTKNPETAPKGVFFVKSPGAALALAAKKGFKKLLLIGGGTINSGFLKAGLIDEIYLDIHPLIFGKGIKLFESFEGFLNVDLVESRKLAKGQIMMHYRVNK